MTARHVAQSLFPEIQADKPVGPLPLSVQTGTNSDLMWSIRDLYLTGSVLDVTYGEGGWWRRFQPEPFTAHDLYKLDGVDFRALPEADRSVDAVCFDPPYVAMGGLETSTRQQFAHSYGIGRGHTGYASQMRILIREGLTECVRVSRRWVLVKCMEYADGRLQDIPFEVTTWALALGCVKHDQIVLAPSGGPGPGGHNIWEAKRCRRAHSYLLVFSVPA